MQVDSDQRDTSMLIPPAQLQRAAGRLAGVTGFLSTIHDALDDRASVFNRYFHVRRVVWTALWIALANHRIGRTNKERVVWLAWAHDLNRWPFAHNSERGVYPQLAPFNQNNDIRRFLGTC